MGETLVRFDHVSKRFRLGESHGSLRDLIAAGLRRLSHRHAAQRNQRETFWALREVSFRVARGKALGIIGPNGAGKSTVLKLLAGILQPDHGSIQVHGRLAALIEVGAGFHGDLTGRENIYLNGAILGMSRREIRHKLDDIVAFAGLQRFIDTPVKRYSSGMYARLGFSIASHVDPDILLVDEVLSVGDAIFRLRCMQRMSKLVEGGTTLVFVTHNLEQMQSICPQAVVLEGGRSVFAGPAREAVGHYLHAMSQAYATRSTDLIDPQDGPSGIAEVAGLRFVSHEGEEIVWARASEPIRVVLTFGLRKSVSRLVVELNMRAAVGENLLSLNAGRDGCTWAVEAGRHTVTLALPAIPLRAGHYFWNVRMWDADRGTTLVDTPFRYPFVLDDEGRATGTLCLDHEWSIKTADEPALVERSAAKSTVWPTDAVTAGADGENLPVQ